MSTWVEQVERQATILLDQMAVASVLASRLEIDPEEAVRPYLEMLNRLYAEELPCARALDHADQVLSKRWTQDGR